MNMEQKKPLNIFLVNYDWRDIFRTSKIELEDKLKRDQLNPSLNKFFFFSWANESYYDESGRWKTLHKKTRIFKLKPLLDLLTCFHVSAAVNKFKLHIDVWMTYDFGMLPSLWVAKKIYGGKVVLVLNNQPEVYSKTRRFGRIKGFYSRLSERLWWRMADSVFTINQTMENYLVRIGVPKSKITVFSMDTISRDQKYISDAKKGEIRKKFGLSDGTKILLTVARLEAEKNYERLLTLFSGLGDGYFLICLGRGSLLPKLTELSKELGIEKRVAFPGFVHRDEIWNYYYDSDVFVLISKAEALGVVFWEAMHAGVPVVGSEADGIVETIGSDGQRGRIWKESDGQEGFNAKIGFCLAESKEKTDMINRAKEYVDMQRKNEITINDLQILLE